MKTMKVAMYGATALIGLMSSANALAQQAGTTPLEAAARDDIVVTATRVETRLQDTPIAVTALSATALTERNVTNLLDVSKFVPGLSIGTRAATGSAGGAISIRGMGVNASDSSAAVGIYVDDVYFGSGRGNILGLMDTQRVEVLRGPQGTLFGRNTIAGAIQYVSQAPGDKFGGYLTGTYGSFDRTDVSAALNLPVSETFALRLAGTYTNRDGYIHDELNNVDRGSDETWALRARARFEPSDNLRIDLKAEHLEQQTNGRAVLAASVNPNAQFVGLAVLFGETRPLDSRYLSRDKRSFPGFNAPEFFKFDFSTANANIEYEFNEDVSLKSITSYSKYKFEIALDYDGTPLSIFSGSGNDDRTRVFTQEVQLNGSFFDGFLDISSGLYYYNSLQKVQPNLSFALGFGPASNLFGDPKTKIDAKAVYGNAALNFSEKFFANVGLRYSSEKNTTNLIGVTAPSAVKFNDLSPSFGLNFKPNDGTLIYAKASKGFRAGGFVPNSALPGNGFAFDQETAWTYEAGLRLEAIDRRLRFNPTLFQTKWKKIQFNRLISTPTAVAAVTDNVGDAKIKGFELETQFDVSDNFQLNGSLTLLDGKYTRVDPLFYATFPFGFLASFPDPVTGAVLPGSTVVLPNVTLDSDLQQAPKVKYAIGARYIHPLDSGAKITTNADYVWTDKQQSNLTLADQVLLPSYGVLSARIQYSAPGDRYTIALFGTNLTNKNYLIGGTDFAGGYTSGVELLDPARPREVGVEVRFNF